MLVNDSRSTQAEEAKMLVHTVSCSLQIPYPAAPDEYVLKM